MLTKVSTTTGNYNNNNNYYYVELVDCLVDAATVRSGRLREGHVAATIDGKATALSTGLAPNESGGLVCVARGDVMYGGKLGRGRGWLTLVASAEQVAGWRMLIVVVLLLLLVVIVLIVAYCVVASCVISGARLVRGGGGGGAKIVGGRLLFVDKVRVAGDGRQAGH